MFEGPSAEHSLSEAFGRAGELHREVGSDRAATASRAVSGVPAWPSPAMTFGAPVAARNVRGTVGGALVERGVRPSGRAAPRARPIGDPGLPRRRGRLRSRRDRIQGGERRPGMAEPCDDVRSPGGRIRLHRIYAMFEGPSAEHSLSEAFGRAGELHREHVLDVATGIAELGGDQRDVARILGHLPGPRA
jgi:hypothetical protein